MTNESNAEILDRIQTHLDLRLRYQRISPDALPDGHALTLRAHAGAEVDLGKGFRLLTEFEGIFAPIDRYDDGTRPQSGLPLIVDPEGLELNRLQLTSELIPQTRMTLGRQRIALDDWRFLGAWPFRQNDQTIDALRVETRALGPGVLDVGVFNRVNRIQGNDNPAGIFRGTSWYANYALQSRLGRISVFNYDFALKTPLQDMSTVTTGARILGRLHSDNIGFMWEGSYARQQSARANPNRFGADYWLGRLSVERGRFVVSGGIEVLGSDEGQAVQAPLGAGHLFSGLADRFMRTPDQGLQDRFLTATYNFDPILIVEDLSLNASLHSFKSDAQNLEYGKEVDFSINARFDNVVLSAEFAQYFSDALLTDTTSTVVSLTYLWDN